VSQRLIVAALVQNEMSRYMQSALAAWSSFADKIVLLDDASSDETYAHACTYEKVAPYQRYEARRAWGAEAPARADLWQAVWDESKSGDALLWLDADMVPAQDPRELLHPSIDTYYFSLYDLWGSEQVHVAACAEAPCSCPSRLLYRSDPLWSAHMRPRSWMVRRPRSFSPEWPTRGIHCGHLPANWRGERALFAPPSHALLHYAYADERDRASKHARYLELGDKLTPAELVHARTIVDPTPRLLPLLGQPRFTLERAK
jgi:hypothetical protein